MIKTAPRVVYPLPEDHLDFIPGLSRADSISQFLSYPQRTPVVLQPVTKGNPATSNDSPDAGFYPSQLLSQDSFQVLNPLKQSSSNDKENAVQSSGGSSDTAGFKAEPAATMKD